MNIPQKAKIVVPVFNEEKNIKSFFKNLYDEIKKIKNYDFRICFIDDGSEDQSYNIIKQLINNNLNIELIRLSRNFGPHQAISAAFNQSKKDNSFLIVLPCDMEKNVSDIPHLIKKFEDGANVVWTYREKRVSSYFNNFFSKIFYKILRLSPEFKKYPKKGTSAFFLIDQKVLKIFNKYSDGIFMINTIIYNMGFNQQFFEIKEHQRKHGKSSWTFSKKYNLALDIFLDYSNSPLRFLFYLSIFLITISFLTIVTLLMEKVFFGIPVPGWTSIVMIIIFFGSLNLFFLGVVGEYIWKILRQTKRKPNYIIDEEISIE